MVAQKIYLITGANRGIGKGFVHLLLRRRYTTVIAAVRDLSHPTARELASFATAEGSQLLFMCLDSSKANSAQEAVQALQDEHSIKYIDVVIANAGIAKGGSSVRATTTENIMEHFLVNTAGPVALFQATSNLLQQSPTQNPIFVAMSSMMGSIGYMEALAGLPSTHSPYGASKAALNWYIRRLHFEEPWLTVFAFHPGVVDTDMVAAATVGTDLRLEDLGAISVETSVSDMVAVIDGATKQIGGTLRTHENAVLPW
ncbi:short-chain dehydrogenase [Stagonosporopsis vannaccii]|nr:short-chain dehydrogenase [Stagonosporopsis vannaccii]